MRLFGLHQHKTIAALGKGQSLRWALQESIDQCQHLGISDCAVYSRLQDSVAGVTQRAQIGKIRV